MGNRPTCETCQAFNKTRATTDNWEGECCLHPKPIIKKLDDFCMQHIPIETECEHTYIFNLELDGLNRCNKCNGIKPIQDHDEPTQAEKNTEPEETECEHEYCINGPWIQCTKCGAHHPSMNTPKDLGMEDIHPVDDHSPEAKLKDACKHEWQATPYPTSAGTLEEASRRIYVCSKCGVFTKPTSKKYYIPEIDDKCLAK